MARLSEDDALEIIEVLEEELQSAYQIDRIEKMRMRSKIRHQAAFLRTVLNPSPKKVVDKLRNKLPDVFRALPHHVSDTLEDVLSEKIRTSK